MTQVKSAQEIPRQVALRKRADARTLAQRRADFEAQMRDMALSDLAEVSKRLRGLRKEFEQADGRKWTDYDLAAAMKIPVRTFQSWQNGEVENEDGKGYDKMARFYSRKLGRKITRQWIVFGDKDEPRPTADQGGAAATAPESDQLNRIENALEDLAIGQAELTEKLDELLAARGRGSKHKEDGG